MRTLIILLALAGAALAMGDAPDANHVMDKVDANLTSDSRIIRSKMVVHGARSSRTITSQSHARKNVDSFTEYLSPPREQGTKMLKLDDSLWIYSPSSDRIIKISGHMLRQSVMGSDLSYEDMMETRKWSEVYNAAVVGEENLDGRATWILELKAKVTGVAYESRKVWVDQERFVPLQEELFAKSGQLLKKTIFSQVKQIEGRWYPMQVNYKDMLKDGKGTDFILTDIQFNPQIPNHVFSKASLRK